MACKYLHEKPKVFEPEVGGSPLPSFYITFNCQLGRHVPETISWEKKCQQTHADGPCWKWPTESADSSF